MHRCSICDRTDNSKLALNADNFYQGKYFPDPRNPKVDICEECFESIFDAVYEMELNDDNPLD